jgi:hypothetical protein
VTKQAHSQEEVECRHPEQGLCFSVHMPLHLGQTEMEVYLAGRHLDYKYSMPTQEHQVRERLDADSAVLDEVGSTSPQAWPREEEVRHYRSAALEEHYEVVVVAGSAVDDLAVQHEDHIGLQVDESSTEWAVAIFGHSADPHSGSQMVLLKIRKCVSCGRIVAVELVLAVVVLHKYTLVVEAAAEAAVRSVSVSASAVWEATAVYQHHSSYTPRIVTYRSWKLCLTTRYSSIYAWIVSWSSALLSLLRDIHGPILWLLVQRIRRRRLLPLIARRRCRIAYI